VRGIRRVTLVAVGLLVAGTVQATGQPAAYAAPVVYDLGILPGQSWSEAYAINHDGYVVGRSGSQAVAWTPDLAIFRLPGLPGATASAIQSINYGRYGVGWSSVNGRLKAVQWPDLIGGGFALAPNYDGDTMALAINDQYEVFGLIKPTQPTNSAVWYAAQFTPSGVVRLNNPGYIVEDAVMGASNGPPGTNIIAGTTCRAVPCTFNYGYESGIGPPTSGGIMALPSITGSSHAKATDVGDDGTQIVGGSSTADGTGSHVTQWTLGHNSRGWPTWTLHDLGAPRTSDGSP